MSGAIVPRGQQESEIHNARVRVTVVMARTLGSTILPSQRGEGGFGEREEEKGGGENFRRFYIVEKNTNFSLVFFPLLV